MILSKGKRAQVEEFLSELLDSQDADVIVVRGKDCKILYTNGAAAQRISDASISTQSCKRGYSDLFPHLCERCTGPSEVPPDRPFTFDVASEEGQVYSATCNQIEWLDGQPATVIFLRNVNEERSVQQKLFSMAYIDQLTKVPNRQKLKEDFEDVRDAIVAQQLCGLIAIFDLDNFKAINDSYGHNTGDLLLRRLTEHIQGDPLYNGHLYRLGGDEFVFFYTEPAGRFHSEEEYRSYYSELFKGAFMSYTMPNIERSCTISMGAAFLPLHGDSYSELLRKADIALYKAKEAGRDQLVFFEDQYDTAEKFKDLYIGIQPILRENRRTFGYELIDRGNEDAAEEGSVSLTEFNRTIDALGLSDLENDARYFISFSKQLLDPLITANLPKDKFIIELSASEAATPEGMERYKTLRKNGFIVALTGLTAANCTPAVMELAGYCKFEPGAVNDFNISRIISAYPKKIFIAERVDNAIVFNDAKRRGFKMFQGFFFDEDQPVIKKKQKISIRSRSITCGC